MYSNRIQRSYRCCAVRTASVKTVFYKAAVFLLALVCIAGLYPLAARAEYTAETPRDTVRVGFFAMDGYHMMDEDGRKSGYGYDFLRLMARYWDVEYEYIGYDKGWSDMQQMLENGEIDIGTATRKTPEREEKFDFSRPIGSNECMLTVRSDNTSVIEQVYTTYDGLRVGFLNGNMCNDDFDTLSKEKGFTYTPVYFDLVVDMEKALRDGQVDALVSNSMRDARNERVVEKFAPEPIYAIVKKGNTALLAKINAAIDEMNAAEGDWKTTLFNRYYTSVNDKNPELTEDEKALVRWYNAQSEPLRVLCDPTREPYSFMENGEIKGILPDYFKELAKYAGLSYQFIPCHTREEYLALREDESFDIAIDACIDEGTAESNHLGVTAPYITVRSAKVVRRDFDGEIQTVATADQRSSGSIEDAYAPNAEKILCATWQDAIQAVKDGRADAAFVYYYMAQEFVSDDTSGSLVYTLLNQPSFQYRIIIAPSISHALAGVLTKAIYAMPDKTIENIASGYTSYSVSDMTLKMLVQLHPMATLVIAVTLLMLLVLLAALTLRVRVQNKKLSDALEKEKRDKQLLDKLCIDFTVVYDIELNTGGFVPVKIAENTNADVILNQKRETYTNFDEYAQRYAECFLSEKDRPEFISWFTCANMEKLLTQADRTTYHYKSVPNASGQQYFEAQAVKIYSEQNVFHILLAFRYIDDILEKEEAARTQLQRALDEARLNNEIISAIAKNYCSIYRIDLQRDYFEEISNDDETHRLTGNNGCASEKLYQLCDATVVPEYRDLVRRFMDVPTLAERLKKEEYISTEYRMCDGSWHSLRFIAKKRDEAGNVTHVLCAVRSISSTKRREQDLRFAAEAAMRESEMKTRFLATMSHDIRTPLNGIIGMINMGNQYADDPEMQQKIRDKEMESLRYLVSIVNDVLDMNKLQSGEIKKQEVTFDLTAVLRDLNQTYHKKAAEKDIRYQIARDKDTIRHPFVIGNPVHLSRILSNITDNAIKFSPPGSAITVWSSEEQLDGEHTLVTFVCRDQGIGMSEEFSAHAFDMFTQEKVTSRSTYQGTGLGLAIVKQLVDRMGGSITLQSRPGAGTTVTVKLPFKIGKQDDLKPAAQVKGDISFKGLRALVVEDNELNMEIACCMLENSGMEVTRAADGQEAVELFGKSAPGCFGVIYMDIMMPRMNGWDAARTIRAMNRPDAEIIPIIAMSANAFSEDIMDSRLAGMDIHLAKPLDEAKMINALKQCIAERSAVKLRNDL